MKRAQISRRTVLVLGGTWEARALAAALDDRAAEHPVRVISTLAGRVAHPRLPRGEVRVGGFGGPGGLADYLREEGVSAVVDATHPFAERTSWTASEACAQVRVPLLRLERPAFERDPAIDWREVPSLKAAAALLPAAGRRVFLTTGRQGLAVFRTVTSAFFLVRCVDPPDPRTLPPDHELVLDRGPYGFSSELALIDRHALDVLVTKDSGGAMTESKLSAASHRGLPVIVVARPPRPDGRTVQSVEQALAWLDDEGGLGVVR